MAPRNQDRYRDEPYRGERGYARDERGFEDRFIGDTRPWLDEEEAERRQAGEAERRRARQADRLYRRDYGPYDYGWGSEGRWREPGYGYGYPGGSERGWTEPGWRDREYEARRYGPGSETGRDTSWSGTSSSTYRPYSSQYTPRYDTRDRGERQREGPFAGRGPKGYQRADSRIREDVCDRLTDAPFLDASDIEVNVKDGDVTLSGTVRSREERRRSEDLIEHVTGVRDVHNNLRVNRSEEGTNVGP
jgi:hypothetical protein